VVLLGVGPDQAGFIRFFEQTLAPQLRALQGKAKTKAAPNGKGKSARKR
jgi:hypothetical protein